MYTQYKRPKEERREHSNPRTLVTQVQTIKNSERIMQALISGQLLEAGRVGYDYSRDDKLPDFFSNNNTRYGRDITEQLDFLQAFGVRMREHVVQLSEQHVEPVQPVQSAESAEPKEPAQPAE